VRRNERQDPKDYGRCTSDLNNRSLDPLLKLEKEIVKDFDEKYINLLCTILFEYKRLDNIPKQKEYFVKCDKIVVSGAKQLL